jgi:hypothetical protein
VADPSISMGETPNSPESRQTSGLDTGSGGTNPGRTEIPPPADNPARPPSGPREAPDPRPDFDNPPPEVPHPGEAPTGPGPDSPGPRARTGSQKPEEWPGG